MSQLFKRNLGRCGQTITIEDRKERIVNGKSREVFSNPVQLPAIVKTLRGVKVFDGTNTERVATHEFCIEARRSVTSESITFSGLTATATTATPHGLKGGTVGGITGAIQPQYNQPVVITVTSGTTFTYPLPSAPSGDATGSPQFTYVQGYTSENWVTLKRKRLKILTVTNCCEKDEVLQLMCTERGEDSAVVNRA